MKFEIYSTKLGDWDDTLLVEYPQLKQFNMTRQEGNIVQYYITISSLEELEKLGKLLGEEIIIDFESYQIEIYDYYRE
jgi:hypothetical protein